MVWRLRRDLLLLVFVLAVQACSDDDNPVSGGSDTRAPFVVTVTAIDLNHVEARFSEPVQRESAELSDNYSITGDLVPVEVGPVSLKADQRTVVITTAMIETPYELTVSGVKDMHGNAIQEPVTVAFMGTHDPDVTPPEIVYRSPAPNATGVAADSPIVIQFSEEMRQTGIGIRSALSSVDVDVDFDAGGTRLSLYPITPLSSSTEYTIRVLASRDRADNLMADVSWSFVTAEPTETTRPTIVESTPGNNATNVELDAEISVTFSEPMVETDLDLQTSPPFQVGSGTWSNGGKTWRASLITPLEDDRWYTFTVVPNENARDLDGNALIPSFVRFTTGSTIPYGGIGGTLYGDEQSNFAADPSGAVVFAEPQNAGTGGWAIARRNDVYFVGNLPDDDYLVMAALETNGNVFDLDPATGDAFGIFGLDLRAGDQEEELLSVVAGEVNDYGSFPLYDSSAITGHVEYAGAHSNEQHNVGVGLFDVNGYTPGADPVYTTDAYWPDSPEFAFASYATGPSAGTFYLGAYLDVNDNDAYDDGEPVGFYGGDTLGEITVANGSDQNGLVIVIEDAQEPLTSVASAWRITKTKPHEWVARASRALERRLKETQQTVRRDVHVRP